MMRYDVFEQNFDSMDKDNDGSLSRQEWHHDKKQFDRLDENRDGRLSFEEYAGVR